MPASIEARDLITQFVGELVTAAQLSQLPDEYKESYRRQLEGQVMERIGFAALRALPEGDAVRAGELAEQGEHDALLQLFQKNIPHFKEIVAQTLREFRDQFLAGAAATRETITS